MPKHSWNWIKINQHLKSSYPRLQRFAKYIAQPCLEGRLAVPIPKVLAGHLVWTQGRLLTADPPEAHILEWILQTVSLGATFLDVGAHYGWMSMAAARAVGSSGRVVAFEPSLALVQVLRYHKRVNRLSQMSIVHAAVSNSNDHAVPFFLLNQGLSFRNSLTIGEADVPYVKAEDKECIHINSITLDDLVSRSGIIPDVVKLDVEGAELLVLQGAENMLDACRPLIVGVHPYWLPKQHTVQDILRLLRKHRYRICDEHSVRFDGHCLTDYLCRPA